MGSGYSFQFTYDIPRITVKDAEQQEPSARGGSDIRQREKVDLLFTGMPLTCEKSHLCEDALV